jgi:hypothetical protein
MSEDNKQLVVDFYRRWDAADPTWGDIVSDDFTVHFGGLPTTFNRREMDDLNAKFYAAFDVRRHEWYAMFTEGDFVCSRGAFIATCSGAYGGDEVAGVEIFIDALTQHRIRDGLVVEEYLCIVPRPNAQLPANGEPMASLMEAILTAKAAAVDDVPARG